MIDSKETLSDQNINFRGTLFVLNIKLLHNQKPENYIKLLTDLVNHDYVVNLRGEHYIELIRLYKGSNGLIYRGELVTYMGIRSDAWFNKVSKEIEEHCIDDNLFANTTKGEFFFVPDVHRIGVFANSPIKINQVKTFFDKACKKLLGEDQVHTIIETSYDSIKQIIEAPEISRVQISLSYSNKDYSEGFAQVLDNKAKEANLSTIDIDIRSAKGESLNLKENGLIRSALELVPSNGTATAVTRVDVPDRKNPEKKKRKRIFVSTDKYPRRIAINCKLNELRNEIYSSLMGIFGGRRSNG